MRTCLRIVAPVVLAAMLCAGRADAHHEALFGPQSSLAVEAPAFVSMQAFMRATGKTSPRGQESTFILSGGVSPFHEVPIGFALIQPFTYETTNAPNDQSGPFFSCNGCFRAENTLLTTQYRFGFEGLQRSTGKDGNFAMVSAGVELPTGNKEHRSFEGPLNGVAAGLVAFEWSSFSVLALGYYRAHGKNDGAKKGDIGLYGGGFAYTPIDREDSLLSFQLGISHELHARDWILDQRIDQSGGWVVLASPTIVWSPVARVSIFALVSLPLAQSFRDDGSRDRYRLGLGLVYAFSRSEAEARALEAAHP